MRIRPAGEVINGGYNISTYLSSGQLIEMKQNWIEFLQKQGLREDCRDFGEPTAELLSAQSATIVTPLSDVGLMRVAGEDGATFLNNMLTNDVNSLLQSGVHRSGLCSPKGRLLATFLIWHEGADLMLALSADLHAAILKKLSMYVLRSKVKLSDASDDRILIGISGPEAAKALAELGPAAPELLGVAGVDHGQVMRLGEQSYLLAADAAAAEGMWMKLTTRARPAGLAAWHWLEILAGMPMVTAATHEEFIPQMINFDLIGGVSFKKGCYPGQEIVARTHYLGKIKRRMYRAHLDTGFPAAGAHLYAPETGDQSCGRVVSSAPAPQGGNDLLAVIQSSCAETGDVHLDSPSGPRLTFQPLPYAVDAPETAAT